MILTVILEREIQKKKIRSRTEYSFKDYHCSLLTDDSIRKSCWRSDHSMTDTLSKKDQSMPLTVNTYIDAINNGYLSDNAVAKSLKAKKKYTLIIVLKLNIYKAKVI